MSIGEIVGTVVISKCGHDKGACYVLTKIVDDKFVLVSNGENRPLSKPKRKNIVHLSVTRHRTAATSDVEIRKVISSMKKEKMGE
jgi:ribosomal protein L14E/L6E/L27E